MPIKIIAVGKRHESWVAVSIERYQARLRRPFDVGWELLPHSSLDGDAARREESGRILTHLKDKGFVVLLDETGVMIDSPTFSKTLLAPLESSRPVVIIIGGAYGVDESIKKRADFTWSLSHLVFPHQLVRLLLIEQLYRAQEIAFGRHYHHE